MNYLHGLRMLITIMKIGSWLKAIDLSSITTDYNNLSNAT